MKLAVVAAVLLVGGCTSRVAGPDAPAPSSPPTPPTRDQVLLADALCQADAQLATEVAEARHLVDNPADEYSLGPDHYLAFVATTVSSLVDQLDALSDSGIEAVDRYASSLSAELARIEPEVERLARGGTSEAEKLNSVKLILEQCDSIEPEGTDLRTVARENPEFAAAYDLAPSCEPLNPPSSSTAPPPRNVPPSEARDGTDLDACADGNCEVAITESAILTVGSFTLEVTVADGEVTTVENYPGGGQGSTTMGGVGGLAQFGNTEETITLSVNGLDGDTAVLEFSLT